MSSPPADEGLPSVRALADAPPWIPDYELVRRIGHGAYGEVWLARGVTGAWRAIKIVWRHRFPDAEPFAREFRGVKNIAALSAEAGLLPVLHVGQGEGDRFFYYVMELADDATRGRIVEPAAYVPLTLRELRALRGRLPVDECIALGVALARALAALHARGLLHRDIKPSNVVLIDAAPKLADIGLVAPTSDALTFIGTEGFIPPEGPGSAAADVFALGKVLYELATGLDRTEFPRLPAEFDARRPPARFFDFNEILLRACAPARAQRYPDAAALLADLTSLAAGRPPQRSRRRALIRQLTLASLALALLAAAVVVWNSRAATPAASNPPSAAAPAPSPSPSVAVLAFQNLSDDPGREYFSDGVSEDLLAVLAKIPGLKVAARSSAFYFKSHPAPLAEIGRKLGVAYLLQGSVRPAAHRILVRVQLIRAADGQPVWSETFDRDPQTILSVPDEVAAQLTRRLLPAAYRAQPAAALAGPDAARSRPKNPAAYPLFLEGRFLLHQRRAASLVRAADLFREAVRLDPDLAAAWANLAQTYSWLYSYEMRTYGDTVTPGLAAARRAVELAPDLADGHAALANIATLAWDWAEAQRSSARALSLAPRDPDVLQTAAWVALTTGDVERCIDHARRAIEADPFNLAAFSNLLMAQIAAKRYAEAETVGARIRAVDPNMFYDVWARRVTALAQHRPAELLDEMEHSPEARARTSIVERTFWSALALHGLGRHAESAAAQKEYAALNSVTPYSLAHVHAFVGALDAAFADLEQAFPSKPGQMSLIRSDPFLENLHSDPRWPALLRRMGFQDLPSAPPPAAAPMPAAENSLAVLPFSNLGGDAAQEYFSDGLTEELQNALAREPDLRVAPRTSSFAFKGRHIPAAEIARTLAVAQLVEGSVRRTGNQVRIEVQLNQVTDGFVEALGTFEGDVTAIFALQDEVAHAVVARLTRHPATRPVPALTANAEAYDLYLRARELQFRSVANLAEVVILYERAVGLDPGFAVAWARLGGARFRIYSAGVDRRPEVVASARTAVEHALLLQPDLAVALLIRANIRREVDVDFDGARHDLELAAAQPGAPSELPIVRAFLAAETGDWASVERYAAEFTVNNPLDGNAATSLGVAFWWRGRYALADQYFERAMAIQGFAEPGPFADRVRNLVCWRGAEAALKFLEHYPPEQAARDHLRVELLVDLGRLEEARTLIDLIEKAAGLSPDSVAATMRVRPSIPPEILAAAGATELARRRAAEWRVASQREFDRGNRSTFARRNFVGACIVLGDRAAASAELDAWAQEIKRKPTAFARYVDFQLDALSLYARLDRREDAIATLQAMLAEGFQQGYRLRAGPEFAVLRGEPRFQALMKQTEAQAIAATLVPAAPASSTERADEPAARPH